MTWKNKYLCRGLERSGIPAGRAGVLFDDFPALSRWKEIAPGPATIPVPCTGGALRFSAGPFQGHFYVNGFNNTFANALQPFYVAARCRAQQLISTGYWVLGLYGGGPYVVGYLPTFGNKFMGLTANGGQLSSITADTSWHDLEIWTTGGAQFWLSVDDEPPKTWSEQNLETDPIGLAIMLSGSDEGIDFDLDKVIAVYPTGNVA